MTSLNVKRRKALIKRLGWKRYRVARIEGLLAVGRRKLWRYMEQIRKK